MTSMTWRRRIVLLVVGVIIALVVRTLTDSWVEALITNFVVLIGLDRLLDWWAHYGSPR